MARPEPLIIRFLDVPTAEQTTLAASLEEHLLDVDASVQVERKKTDNRTQDPGSTLAIIVGSHAAVALARGLTNWLINNSGVRIEITSSHGKVIGTNLNSKDAAAMVKSAFS